MMEFLKFGVESLVDWYLTYYGRGWRPALRFVIDMLLMAAFMFVISALCAIE